GKFTVYSPSHLEEVKKLYTSPAIIVSCGNSVDRIIEFCESFGFVENTDLIRIANLTPNMYTVDISSICNLRCIMCPQGLGLTNKKQAEFMSPSTFKKVVDKITAEDPYAVNIQLFQWGEPLLNKNLPEIISIAHEKGLLPSISSNLNANVDLEPIIKAKPSWFRISLSGFGPRYEVTHTGGKFPVLYEHLNNLYDLTKKYNSDTKVQVFYHLYKDNLGDDLRKAREFCETRGFEFLTTWASIVALDELLVYKETGYLPDKLKEDAELLGFDIDRALSDALADAYKPCQIEKIIYIKCDLSVMDCSQFFHQDNYKTTENFLETPLSDIIAKKKQSKLCISCKRHGIHRYCEICANYPTDIIPAGFKQISNATSNMGFEFDSSL
ncbi:MAG: radical SAM protein, partial [Deltaproteobacteria bacterium]|nr:radical SAM protein [Deltaproteobacteria bacterium]